MKIQLLILIWLFASPIFAQKKWSETPLTFADFKGEKIPSVPYSFTYRFEQTWKKEKQDKTIHRHYEITPVFVSDSSFLTNTSNENSLRLCQVFFDYAEYVSRNVQYEVNLNTYDYYQTRLKKGKQTCDDQLGFIAMDTKYGLDTARIRYWEKHTDSLLQVTPRIFIPNYKRDKLSISYAWGANYNQFSEQFASHYSNPITISNTIHFGWKRWHYGMQLSFLGKTRAQQMYASSNYSFPDKTPFVTTHNHFVVGYEIIRPPQFTVTPLVGFSTIRFTRTDLPEEDKTRLGPLRGSLTAGMAIDLKSQAFHQNNDVQFRYGLQIRAMYARYRYNQGIFGDVISIGIHLNLYMQHIQNIPYVY